MTRSLPQLTHASLSGQDQDQSPGPSVWWLLCWAVWNQVPEQGPVHGVVPGMDPCQNGTLVKVCWVWEREGLHFLMKPALPQSPAGRVTREGRSCHCGPGPCRLPHQRLKSRSRETVRPERDFSDQHVSVDPAFLPEVFHTLRVLGPPGGGSLPPRHSLLLGDTATLLQPRWLRLLTVTTCPTCQVCPERT